MAGWTGRQGKRRRGRRGSTDVRSNRLCRADLRRTEQNPLWQRAQCSGRIREGLAGQRNCSSGIGEEYAAGFPGIDHQCARKGCLSDLKLHLVADSGAIEGCGEGEDYHRFPELDGRRRPEDDGRSYLRALAEQRRREGESGDQTGALKVQEANLPRGLVGNFWGAVRIPRAPRFICFPFRIDVARTEPIVNGRTEVCSKYPKISPKSAELVSCFILKVRYAGPIPHRASSSVNHGASLNR